MKIAVPTRNNEVDGHFGHCEFFTVFTVEEKEIKKSEIVQSPIGCGCKSDIAGILKNDGVSLMLVGNMGHGALMKLNQHGIDVIRGCSGSVDELVNNYMNGEIQDSGESCEHHHHGDHHGHHHH